MTPPRPALLLRALVARELDPRRALPAGLLVGAAAALLGHRLLAQALPDGVEVPAAVGTPEAFGAHLVARVGGVLAVPCGVAAAAIALSRVTRDHEDGWLPALVAAGPPSLRAHYLLGVLAATVAAVVLHWSLASLAVAIGGGAADDALRRTAVALPGAAALAVSAAAYGVAWGALLRRRGPAAAAAIGGVVAPIAAATAWRVATGEPAPDGVARLLALPIPPLAWSGDAGALLRHALYVAALLVPLTLLAPRLVARTR